MGVLHMISSPKLLALRPSFAIKYVLLGSSRKMEVPINLLTKEIQGGSGDTSPRASRNLWSPQLWIIPAATELEGRYECLFRMRRHPYGWVSYSEETLRLEISIRASLSPRP